MMMRRTLAVKLTLAFLLVSLIGVGLVALFSRLITVREFDRLTLEQAKSNFIADVSAYYQATGSWQNVDNALRQRLPQQPGIEPPPRPPAHRFGLAGLDGLAVIPGGPFRVGDRVPPEVLVQGTPLKVDGQVVGTILFTNLPPPRDPLETQYLARIDQALVIAAVAATFIALGLGIFLARTLTRPLRELTEATQAMGRGDLNQTVPVRSEDELGRLAVSFNRMSADLARSNQIRRQMTADIAHDLRTPLTVISGYLEALRDGDLAPTLARFEAMHAEAQHLNGLVQDLRTLSLADAGELTLNRQSVPVPELLRRVAGAYQHQANKQHISLDVRPAAGLPELDADPERLVQVLGNLVSNALRHTPPEGQVALLAETSGDNVLMAVKDTGPGIPPEDLPHIFNRFYRGDQSRRQTEGESGLGLAIVRAIVEAHGGAISVVSEVGQGTAFTIRLPIPS